MVSPHLMLHSLLLQVPVSDLLLVQSDHIPSVDISLVNGSLQLAVHYLGVVKLKQN